MVAAATFATGSALAELGGRHRWTRPLLGTAVAGLGLAMALVVSALVRGDTTLRIVVDNSRPGLGLAYRVMGLWGGSAGSLLTFTVVLGVVFALAPVAPGRRWLGPAVLAILAWTSVLVAPPFERLANPAVAGTGLTPILEHWAMVVHPPLLYLGLALALVPALESRRSGWGHAGLGVLTAALALGGGWAYVELGWGGWWAWDPVENAALIPWLLLVAGLHLPRHHPVGVWSHALVWPAVFAGTAMTRTSLRTSVHAFADADSLGWTLWPLTALVTMTVGWWTVRTAPAPGRRHARLIPAALAIGSAVVVAAGTYRPLLPGDATDGSFYSRFLFPVALAAIVGTGLLPRRHHRAARVARDAAIGCALAVGLALAVGWREWYQVVLAAGIGTGIGSLTGGGLRPAGRFAAHLGLLLVLTGALGATASTTRTVPIAVGDRIVVAGHTIANEGLRLDDGRNPVLAATVVLDDSHELEPRLAVFPDRRLRLPEVATHSRPWEDVQVILRSADDDGSILVTVNVEPLTQMVWIGAVLVLVGVALDQRSRRSRRARRSSSSVDPDPTATSSAPPAGSPSPAGPASTA